MPDFIDTATELQERFREAAIEKVCQKANQPKNKDKVCTECGEEIEPGRLEANPSACRCISCEVEQERTFRYGN